MNILGYEYRVEMEHDLEPMGRVRPNHLDIQISDRICKEQRVSTMLHEVLEAINSHLELKIPHAAIMGLEVGLYQTLTAAGVSLAPLIKDLPEID